MAEITAQAVKELRDLTNLPMMEVKKALVEANGDQKRAIELLKEWNKKVSIKRAENATSEGLIRTAVSADGSRAVMVEVQCESAPVAKADDFVFLVEQLAKQLLNGPGADTPATLLTQTAPDRASLTLGALLEEVIGKIREKMVLARILRLDGPVGAYTHHDGKTGVVFRASGENKVAPVLRDVAMPPDRLFAPSPSKSLQHYPPCHSRNIYKFLWQETHKTKEFFHHGKDKAR